MLALILSVALAQPVSTQACGPGKACRVRSLQTTQAASSIVVPTASFINFYGASSGSVGIRGTGAGIGVEGTNFYTGTSSHVNVGPSAHLFFDSYATATALPAATFRGFTGVSGNNTLYSSDAAAWAPLGTAPHPVLERRVFSLQQAAAGAPQWRYNVSPQIRGAAWNLTVGACVSSPANAGLLVTGLRGGASISAESATCTTTAVANNVQGVHVGADVLMPFGRRFMWCGTVGGITTNTSVRVIAGQSKLAQFTGPADAPTLAGAWFRYSTAAGDTNWMLCTSDGVSAATCTSTGVAVAGAGVAAVGDSLCIDQLEGTAVTAWVNGRARLRVTTNITTSEATTGTVGAVVQTLTAGARVADLGNWSIEGPP